MGIDLGGALPGVGVLYAQTPGPPIPPLREATARPPQVSLHSYKTGSDGTVTVEAQVEDPQAGQVSLVVLQEGVRIPKVTTAQARGLATARRYTLTFTPASQDGVVAIVARSGELASAPLQLRLRRGALERRPALHILAVGVGNYQSTDIAKLRYSSKDATDLTVTLQKQRDLLYREISSRVLVDAQATRAQVLEGLKWLTQDVAAEDTAVVFLAGHGTNDPDGMYYFLPVDARADKTSMLSGAELQEALRRIRGRVVLMLDTCHSGNVLGRKSFNRLVNELSSENRVVVFAASTGEQVARESPAWNNGAFTKAVIEGLRGVADYAEDNQLSISELETWASVRVQQLTSGAQTPTLAKPNAAPDYVIAALPMYGVLPNPKRRVRRRMLWGAGGVLLGVTLGVGLSVGLVVKGLSNQNILMPVF